MANLINQTGKFTKGEENLDLILSNPRPSLNKLYLILNQVDHIVKDKIWRNWITLFINANFEMKFGHLEYFCYDKLRIPKDGKPRLLRTTNVPGPKEIWIPKVKTWFVV